MTAREVIARLKEDGWEQLPNKDGSHRYFKHPTKPGKVCVPDHGGKDIKLGTLKSIARQAGIKLP